MEQATTTKRKRGKRGGRRRGKRSLTEQRIQGTARQRQEAWREGGHANATERLTRDLGDHFNELRTERSGQIPTGHRHASPAPDERPGQGGGMAR